MNTIDMKYNAHIDCAGFRFDLNRLQSLCFLFVLMQSLKTSPALLNHHYHVFICKQKLLNRLSIAHDPRRKHCISSEPLTTHPGRIN